MSELVRNNLDFLRLLLATSSRQSKVLLETITPSQLNVIREIAQNFYRLPVSVQEIPRRQQLLVRALGAKRISQKRLSQLLVKNRILFLNILRYIKDYLEQLA